MQRDMDLIRKILLAIQGRMDVGPRMVTIEGEDPTKVAVHVAMLHAAGLIYGVVFQSMDSPYPAIKVQDMTWEGHDFIGCLDKSDVWEKVKEMLTPAQLATLPMKVIQETALSACKMWVFNKLGLPLN